MKDGRVGGREITDLWLPIPSLKMGLTNRSDLSGSSKSRARLPEFFLVHVRLLLLQGEVSPPWLSSQDETKIPGENTELGPPVHLLRESVRPLGLT